MRPHRPLPHKRATVGAALVSTAAFLAVGLQAVPATATQAAPHHGSLRTGGTEAELSPAQHRALVESAQQHTATTARTLGLGAQEKLVVKDVV
ncbi:M4 family peptidase, partial [Streptomyces sp. SID2955]|nr:M4 family peptidase [Streptomyces sp. SID2955]